MLPGGQLLMINVTVNGSVISAGAGALAICNSTISGQVSARTSSGLVMIGDGGDGTGPCHGNTTPCAAGPPGRCWATSCWPPRRWERSFAVSRGATPANSTWCPPSWLGRAWSAGAGPGDGCQVIIDVDSSIVETYGLAKQGAKFTYSHVLGYHPLFSVIAGSGDVVHCRLRGGNA